MIGSPKIKEWTWRNKRISARAITSEILRPALIASFWRHVQKGEEDECWPWTGFVSHDGYGQINDKPQGASVRYKAHRLSLAIANNGIPATLHACHRCDNPLCVNPKHLFLGTDTDNMRDSSAKGRIRHGVTHPYAKLSEQDVVAIRELGQATSQTTLANRFGVSRGIIRGIHRGRIWKHVP